MQDLTVQSNLQLLRLQADVTDELKGRGILRTRNNPVADYTEWLVSKALNLRLQASSTAGFDAVDSHDVRYEIKGRRVTPENKSTQLSAIRSLDEKKFDVLVGVIFKRDFTVRYAAKIPHAVVQELATYRKHTNAYVLILRPSVLEVEGVEDITSHLAA